jgi:hypothetical protein
MTTGYLASRRGPAEIECTPASPARRPPGMNRRTALLSSLFLGGLVPPRLLAQSQGGKIPNREEHPLGPDDPSDGEGAGERLPGAVPRVSGFKQQSWDISRYTSIPTNVQAPPQKALIDWILLRTGTSEWHGDNPTVLSADRNRLIAYNTEEVLKKVDEIVARFVEASADTLRIQVQFIAAVDPRWRYTVYSRLTYVGGGPQGQQIWTMKSRDAALVLTQIQIQQGFRPLAKEMVEMINGQTLLIKTREPRTFVGGLTPEPSGGIAFQPRPEKIDEGIVLKLSPLLNYDGTAVDAKIDLTVNTVRTLHRTKVIAPRELGQVETTIDVPDATQTHLEQTVRNWRLGQSLIISCGIHPGILDKKSGLFNLPIPGTYPTATEVLVFLDVEAVERERVVRERGGRLRPQTAARRRRRYEEEETAAVDRDQER